uniref:Uncharacterized protein n=1 Tax=Timema cristinae TaxID=61476 RepID=A0A7R9H816_TIMCR|nr:unnamed protein product [Timema cristinae]
MRQTAQAANMGSTQETQQEASCNLDPTSDTNVEISLQEEEVEADSSVDVAFSQGQQENMMFSSSEEALTSLENTRLSEGRGRRDESTFDPQQTL